MSTEASKTIVCRFIDEVFVQERVDAAFEPPRDLATDIRAL